MHSSSGRAGKLLSSGSCRFDSPTRGCCLPSVDDVPHTPQPPTVHSLTRFQSEFRLSWPLLVAVALPLSAFGPYLVAGVRTDQAMAYGLAILSVVVMAMKRPRLTTSHTIAIMIWSLTIVFGMITTITVPAFRIGGEIAMLDNLLLPVAVSLVMASAVTPQNRSRLLTMFATIVVVGTVANSVISVGQMFGAGLGPVSAWLPVSGESNAARSENVGRYMGMLNSPALAGVFYGIALVFVMWLLRTRIILLVVVTTLIILGAIAAVSKAFIFVCLPIAAIYMVYLLGRYAAGWLLAVGGVGLLVWRWRDELWLWLRSQLSGWDGFLRMEELLFGEMSITTITGNRYGETSVVGPVFESVADKSLVGGLGLSGTGGALDSAWVLAFAVAGSVGVAALAAVIVVLTVGLWRRRSSLPSHELGLYTAVLAMVIICSAAAPVFTQNRLTVVLWGIFAIMLCGATAKGKIAFPSTVDDRGLPTRVERSLGSTNSPSLARTAPTTGPAAHSTSPGDFPEEIDRAGTAYTSSRN